MEENLEDSGPQPELEKRLRQALLREQEQRLRKRVGFFTLTVTVCMFLLNFWEENLRVIK